MALESESADWHRAIWLAQPPGSCSCRGACFVGFLALLLWLPMARVGQLKVLLLEVVLLLVFLMTAMIRALKEFHPAGSLANSAAIGRWKKTCPGARFIKSPLGYTSDRTNAWLSEAVQPELRHG